MRDAAHFNRGRVLFAMLLPVVRVTGSPFLGTVQAYLAVFRVRRDLLTVIVGAAPALVTQHTNYRLRIPRIDRVTDHTVVRNTQAARIAPR